jgi:hypothetical protein
MKRRERKEEQNKENRENKKVNKSANYLQAEQDEKKSGKTLR